MLRTLPIAADNLGLVSAGQPEPLMIWDEINGRRTLTDRQEKDPETGELLWTAYVMPTKAERPEVLSVRVRAAQQPVLTLFGPITVESLEVNVRVGKDGKLAQYWSAASIREAGQQGGRRNGQQEHKPEGQAA